MSTRIALGVASFFEYIPVLFLLEEVWFRGVLDSHLHHPGEARGIASAIYVSMLWGLWNYPITDSPHSLRDFVKTVGYLLLVHVFIGTFLSIHWRRSGNLFVTASVHALIDGVRNALLA
jgi:membrane protease YdiL (CAAX protease family)